MFKTCRIGKEVLQSMQTPMWIQVVVWSLLILYIAYMQPDQEQIQDILVAWWRYIGAICSFVSYVWTIIEFNGDACVSADMIMCRRKIDFPKFNLLQNLLRYSIRSVNRISNIKM